MGLLARVYAQIHARVSNTADFGSPTFAMESGATIAHEFTTGTAAGLADRLFSDQRTLAASAGEDLDLSGALLDALGQPAVFAKVRAIMVKAAAGNTNNVVVGGAATNAFVGPFGAAAHTIAVQPGGAMVLVAPTNGWVVTAGTGDLLRIANGGAGSPVTYDLVVVGTSA